MTRKKMFQDYVKKILPKERKDINVSDEVRCLDRRGQFLFLIFWDELASGLASRPYQAPFFFGVVTASGRRLL